MKMKKTTPKTAFRKLAGLYSRMVAAYGVSAKEVGLSCEGCTDNCCYSYFEHHTYIEWAYLWKGLEALPEERRKLFIKQANDYVARAQREISEGTRPRIMCPVNVDGLCGLYEHRFMICRMHGVPNALTKPNGQTIQFAGCWQTQELTKDMDKPPILDRTKLYTDLVRLEMEFVGPKLRSLPKVDLTLAEMIVMGPPTLR